MTMIKITAATLAATILFVQPGRAQAPAPPAQTPPAPLGALAPANLAKPRAKPPFDLTGVWLHAGGPGNGFRFSPPPGFKLTPDAQVHYDAAQKAQKEGKVYRDDIGQCWPAGMPLIMTRVWPIAMVQLPTVIYMVSNFNNEFRQIFLDGRPWTDPDTVIFTYNGESQGHFEGDTLVVDTRYVETYNHYIDTGIPISEEFRMQERIRLLENGEMLEIAYIMTDPVNWKGEWRSTKRWLRVDNTDIGEVHCLPDLNDNLPSTQAGRAGLQQ
jgi:hypothetical protein